MAALSDYYREKGVRNPRTAAVPDAELIDFPCSPAWQGYYYDRGLTPFEGAHNRNVGVDNSEDELRQEIIRLRQAIERRQPKIDSAKNPAAQQPVYKANPVTPKPKQRRLEIE
ncbi:MAG: hypothetical protein HYY29_03580 [Chloroflexi bacterium]|nr:hypothetical protein [Chloroflexota bacterium]